MEVINDITAKKEVNIYIDGENPTEGIENEKISFSTLEEAKQYFMEKCEISLNLDVELEARDQKLYASEEDWESMREHDDSLPDFDEALYAWEEDVDSLLSEYDISVAWSSRSYDNTGTNYIVSGTPNNLISFMEKYTNHFDGEGFANDGSQGEYFSEDIKELNKFINSKFASVGFFRD